MKYVVRYNIGWVSQWWGLSGLELKYTVLYRWHLWVSLLFYYKLNKKKKGKKKGTLKINTKIYTKNIHIFLERLKTAGIKGNLLNLSKAFAV